ncbi:hypothetical protein A9Q89_12815 [Gammaproteobacteria bacterium 53_120_T64]|nr:hypothetical protein A9Q89_12815 [Gammaproteobacteria bacterium 53_120_T64]
MGLFKNWLVLASFLALVGCAGSPSTPPPVAAPQAPIFTPELGLSDSQRLSKAIALLSSGNNVGQAKVELQAYLNQVPNSKIANSLFTQVDTPIGEYFPAEFVAITLTNGESLSTIAKQYLGDALQFYALAQYNNIANPGKTTIGQVIHVPLTSKAQAFIDFKINKGMDTSSTEQDHQAGNEFKDQSGPADSDVQLEVATLTGIAQMRLLLAEKHYQAAIQAYEQLQPANKLNDNDTRALIAAYRKSAIDNADSNPVLASTYYQQTGRLIAQGGDRLLALEMFDLSLQLDSDNEASQRRYVSLKSELTDAYHRDASLAFRRQELERAITLWQKLLIIDPEHVHAINYLVQAQRLKDKLQLLE